MRMEFRQSQRLEQKLILAPRMIQSMEILQLPIMALQERIEQELQENPVLEIDERFADGPIETPEPAPGTDGALVVDAEHDEFDFNRLEALNQDWDNHFNEDHRPSRNAAEEMSERKLEALQNVPAREPSLAEHLTDQLGFLDLADSDADLVRFLISHLDESGYLKFGVPELAAARVPPVPADVMTEALHILHDLDPAGVGARDVRECLILQVTDDTPHADLVRELIRSHLEDVAHNRLPPMQKATGADPSDLRAAIDELKRLDPKPGRRFGGQATRYVTPDVLVERTENGEYEIKLLDDWTPPLLIPPRFYEMCKSATDQKTKDYLKRKLQSAEWLRDAIEQRRRTLKKVTTAIVKHQRKFLDQGPQFIEPLKMQQIADQVGVHVTTVSRAVDDKWVQTPRGVFPLKRFFGGGTQTASGEEVAWETIKNKLLELIGNENKGAPLSDEDLVDKLQEGGYPVARRTVTKYRKLLKIPSSRERKAWAG